MERRRNKQLALDNISSVPLDAWSTSDLVAERKRIQAILEEAPPDRSADLAALAKSRQDIETTVQEHRELVANLEQRKRPRKERKLPEVQLTTARHNLDHFQMQADRLDHEIAALHASQHRRASHLTAHRAEQVELDAIGDVLQERLRQRTNRVVKEPPTYITKTLGHRPTDRAKDRAWVKAVVEIEQYRLEHDITDGRTVLGPRPVVDREAADAWHRVNDLISDAQHLFRTPSNVAQPKPVVEHVPMQIEGPTLDIGM